jgi:insertion element IS1 protein InsB
MIGLARTTNRSRGGQQTAMGIRDACPKCRAQQFKKNGHIHTGKQNYRCKSCGRQFAVHAANRLINEDQRRLVERLLLEKLSLHGICRIVGVGIRWLMDCMVTCFHATPEHLHVRLPNCPCEALLRRVEADEMCRFVKQKVNKPWLWLAMDRATRQITA